MVQNKGLSKQFDQEGDNYKLTLQEVQEIWNFSKLSLNSDLCKSIERCFRSLYLDHFLFEIYKYTSLSGLIVKIIPQFEWMVSWDIWPTAF